MTQKVIVNNILYTYVNTSVYINADRTDRTPIYELIHTHMCEMCTYT